MNDQQAEQNYRQAMGLDCHEDCSAAYYRKKAQERMVKKGYKKLKGYISKAQAFLISNKT